MSAVIEIPYNSTERPDTGLYNAKLGVWLFLASEVMLFGALFSTYVLLRTGAESWEHGAEFLNVPLATINTLVLIISSVTMVTTAASEHLLVTASDLVVPRGLDLLRRPRFLILVDARKQLAGQLDALVGRESLRLFEYRMDVAAHESQLIAVSAVARRPGSLAPALGGLGSETAEGSHARSLCPMPPDHGPRPSDHPGRQALDRAASAWFRWRSMDFDSRRLHLFS